MSRIVFLLVMMTFFAVLALDINVPAVVLTLMAAVNSLIIAREGRETEGAAA